MSSAKKTGTPAKPTKSTPAPTKKTTSPKPQKQAAAAAEPAPRTVVAAALANIEAGLTSKNGRRKVADYSQIHGAVAEMFNRVKKFKDPTTGQDAILTIEDSARSALNILAMDLIVRFKQFIDCDGVHNHTKTITAKDVMLYVAVISDAIPLAFPRIMDSLVTVILKQIEAKTSRFSSLRAKETRDEARQRGEKINTRTALELTIPPARLRTYLRDLVRKSYNISSQVGIALAVVVEELLREIVTKVAELRISPTNGVSRHRVTSADIEFVIKNDIELARIFNRISIGGAGVVRPRAAADRYSKIGSYVATRKKLLSVRKGKTGPDPAADDGDDVAMAD